uniref:Uncharacterized protein AlNc14C1G207 n=1 Tax=Albugo laibachii Nc14 TaxID=890382 RepID=F0VZ66_9STRA|nr:conserved hypothetical protein [Albugo laibachii Nc14]|eukprot:CCA14081.1 conserved hypothetical protein [Albugo laibachii Nc14]
MLRLVRSPRLYRCPSDASTRLFNRSQTKLISNLTENALSRNANAIIRPTHWQFGNRRWTHDVHDPMQMQSEKTSLLKDLEECRTRGNWRRALKLLDTCETRNIPLDKVMYEIVIDTCARMGSGRIVPGILSNMKVDSVTPTQRTVDCVVQLYLADRAPKRVVGYILDIVKMDGASISEAAFSATMETCGTLRDAKSAKSIFEAIEGGGNSIMELSSSHYAMAMRACGMGGRSDYCLQVYHALEKRVGIVRDGEVMTQLIRAHVVNKALPQALEVFYAVNERNVLLNESIYTATIDALVSQGKYWHASKLYNQMVTMDLVSSLFCDGRMMIAYLRMQKRDNAIKCWENIRKHGIHEGGSAGSTRMRLTKLVQSLASIGENYLLIEVFEHLMEHSPRGTVYAQAYAAAIRALGRLGETQKAMDLFEAFVDSRLQLRIQNGQSNAPTKFGDSPTQFPRSPSIYLAVFNALSRDTQRDPSLNSRDAQRVWDLMIQHVPVILSPAYASIAGVFASSGDMETLQRTLDYAIGQFVSNPKEKENTNDNTDKVTGAGTAATGGSCEAASSVGSQEEMLFTGVVSGFSKAREDRTKEILECLDSMLSRGLRLNDPIIRAATDAFVNYNKWEEMEGLARTIDLNALNDAYCCFGYVISKLLTAKAWNSTVVWMIEAHRQNVQPPLRGKYLEALKLLADNESSEWEVAQTLGDALLGNSIVNKDILEGISNTMRVFLNAQRLDRILSIYDRTKKVAAEAGLAPTVSMYTAKIQAHMRLHKTTSTNPSRSHQPSKSTISHIREAEAACAEMLQVYGNRVDELTSEALCLATSLKAFLKDDEDVVALYEHMQMHGIQVNSYALKAATVAYSRQKRFDKILVIRDQLAASASNADSHVEAEVVRSILFSLAVGELEEEMQATLNQFAALGACTTDDVVDAYLRTSQYEQCVKYIDANTDKELARRVLERICNDDNGVEIASVASVLMYKLAALHGIEAIQPPWLITQVAHLLMDSNRLEEAMKLLQIYRPNLSGSDSLDEQTSQRWQYYQKQSPAFQKDVMEMLLRIYGERRELGAMQDLFDQMHAFPLTISHYERAMQYCWNQSGECREKALVQCLQFFRTLRKQFIEPSGRVYTIALQSCQQLGVLNEGGRVIIEDILAQGFTKLVQDNLLLLVQNLISTSAPPPSRGRGIRNNDYKSTNTVENVTKLIQLVQFCHDEGIPATPAMAQALRSLQPYLVTKSSLELERWLNIRGYLK